MSHSSTSNSEDERGLVVAPTGLPGPRLLTFLFLLTTAGVGMCDLLSPPPAPHAIGAEGQVKAARVARATWLDGTRMRLLDDTANDRSNLRHHVGGWLAAILLRYADEASPRVVVGKDGWLFLERRLSPPDLPTQVPAQIWANIFRGCERRLFVRGTKLLLIPVPRRAVAAKAFLPSGYDPKAEWDKAFLDALDERGVPHVNLLSALSGADAGALWARYGTHWSRQGQLVAAGIIAEALRGVTRVEGGAREERLSLLDRERTTPQKSGLLAYAGLRRGSRAQRTLMPAILQPRLMPLNKLASKALLEEGKSDAPLWITGTSFVAGENLLAYLRLELGTRIYSKAVRGQFTSDALALHFEQALTPGHLSVDMPCDQLFQHIALNRGNIRLAKACTVCLTAGIPSPVQLLPLPLQALPSEIRLTRGSVLASGDGALAVRAVAAGRRPGWFQAAVGDLAYSLTWPSEANVCVLPLITSSTQLDEATLHSPELEDAIEDGLEVSLVTPFRAETDSLKRWSSVKERDIWTIRMPLSLPDPIQALWIPALKLEGDFEVLKVHSNGNAREESSLMTSVVTGETLVMVDLGNLNGVTEILLRGRGQTPGKVSAALIPTLR